MKLRASGVDTWSPSWYVEPDGDAAKAMTALAVQPTRRGSLIPEPIDGYRVGWFPASKLVYAEGHPGGDELGAPDELPERLAALEGAMGDVGIALPKGKAKEAWMPGDEPRPGLAGVRRLDLTVDLEAPDGATGLAVLAGIGALEPSRLQPSVRRGKGTRAVETVTWHAARGIAARAYDKGVEAGTAPRGERIRLEAQYRWGQGHRRDPDELTADYVRSKFVARFAPLWKASENVKVVGVMSIPQKLHEALEAGDITPNQADRILGYVVMQASGLPSHHKQRTAERRRAELRQLGLVAADGVLEEREVDLHSLLEEIMDYGWAPLGDAPEDGPVQPAHPVSEARTPS